MITSAKTILKKKPPKRIKDRKNPRRNGKRKAIRQNYKETYTYPLTKREKGKKYIYILKKRKRATK